MRAQTASRVAGCAAAGSVALIGGGLALAYVDRHLVPASQTGWTASNISGQVVRDGGAGACRRICRIDLGELSGRERASEPGVPVPVDGHRHRGP